MLYVTGLALVSGAVIGLATGGRPRFIARHRVRAWWLVLVGFGFQLAADHVDLGSLATVVVVAGAVALLAFASLNPNLVGIGVVAVGVAANALVIGLDNGMPVRPSAVVAAHLATVADEPAINYGYRHHQQRPSDKLLFLSDIIPIPVQPLQQVVSFGDLILAIGVAATVAHLVQPLPDHSARTHEASPSPRRSAHRRR
jgi:hypothetical protein